ncbi:lantibiotic dehydratase [Kineosporia babensis]|uniref:Lantibiotic dehydratase n=1 Tax=Kineosporia babensis TaxID=499548 RepID=A0A9X1SY33_9ACTN|nr:lantibiotic dehydratase [Kineosporia babensis]
MPLLAEAIGAASPDLTRAIEGLLSNDRPSLQETRRVSSAALHYALRAWYRATPFGLFSATGPLAVGETCSTPSDVTETVVARADARWLAACMDRLHANPDVLEGLIVVAEPTHQISQGQVRVPYRPGAVGPHQVTATATAALGELLATAARPIPVAQVTNQLLALHPDVPRDRVLALISAALRNGFLHSNLRPSSLIGFPLTHIRTVLERTTAGSRNQDPTALGLIKIDKALTRARQSPPRERLAGFAHSAGPTAELVDVGVPPLMFDVRQQEPVVVPHRLIQDVAEALDIMARTSAHPQGPPAWKDYRTRFFEKFSLGQLVPIRDVIDPVIGLGYPAGFLGSTWVARDETLTARDAYLLGRAQRLMIARSGELALTSDDIAALDHQCQGHILPGTDVTVAVQAESARDVEQGKYDVVIEGIGSAAGALSGRFLPLGNQSEREQAAAMHRAMPTLDDEAVRVQLCSPPLRWRAQNVARTVHLVPEVLALGEHTEHTTMWLDEIAVAATPDQLYLVHLPSQRRIEPFMPHSVDLKDATDPLARFLVELPRSHVPVLNPFDWGAAFNLPYLPRVRTGRVILRPSRWRLTAADLAGEYDPDQTIQRWRQQWRVPAVVQAGETDRRLRLDLEQPAFRRELATLVRQRGSIHVQEAAPDTAHGWLGRVGQLTLPFAAQQPHSPRRNRPPAPVLRRATDAQRPGTARTVLLRVETGISPAIDVLTAGLRDLLDGDSRVERWWFTRYRDPRQHLRIRITLTAAHHFGQIATLIATWAARAHHERLVGDISWHTDQPETGRYGSGDTLQAAEAFFAADSRAALAQNTPGHDPHERQALLMASLLDITHHLVGDYSQAIRLWEDGGLRGVAGGIDRKTRTLALKLGSPEQEQRFGALIGAPNLTRSWNQREGALKGYRTALRSAGRLPEHVLPALVHLHHVRAYGLDSAHEDHTQRCAREIAHSLLARARKTVTA